MGNINTFIERMRYWCQTADLGYDQTNRQDFRNGGEADCSSLVIHALQEAGFDTGGATCTGNMSSNLTSRGWTRVANDGNPQPGDILLNDVRHVAVYLGNGLLAQASISENGTITGQGGDQTGYETNVKAYYNYPWNCYLRYTGASSSTSGGLVIDGSLGPATVRRWQEVAGTTADGVISGQIKGAWNENVAAIQWGTGGSDLIEACSKVYGITDTPRNMGPDFVNHFLTDMNGSEGNHIIDPAPSQAVMELQRRLNAGYWHK